MLGLGLVLGGLGLGCEPAAQEQGGREGAGDAREAAAGPILPEAPWFELPADWAEQHPTLSPNAQLEVHLRALAEREAVPDPADSAGRLWLEGVTPVGSGGAPVPPAPGPDARPALAAASRHRFRLGFEVGAPGLRDGGALFLLPDPFWFWSEAQTTDPDAPGYTTATLVPDHAGAPVSPPPVRFAPGALPGELRVEGRALVAGERIEVVYGAGPAGAVVDRYAERGAELRLGLDANGDGSRAWLPDRVAIDVVANAPAELVAFGPAEVAPGEAFEIQLALVDAAGNRALWPAAADDAPAPSAVRTAAPPGDVLAQFEILLRPEATQPPAEGLGDHESLAPAEGPHRARLRAPARAGTLRLRVRGRGPLARFAADLPPIVVREGGARLYWADLHGHTRRSDGSGTPDDYFRYARDVARLDAVALTDHDHWGLDPLDERPDHQAEILALVRTYHAPGRFVTIPGYEWTSWLHGHRHVLAFEDTLEIHSSIDPATDRPDELWAALRGRPALTFAHHSAGDPIATNWHFAPDPELEPVTEIASVHGMSEAADAPAPVTGAQDGHFVRDVLRHGARLGFIGSGDSHDGHPGLAQIASGQGGLAGLFSAGLDRASLLAALKARRTFATNGIRAWLDVSIDGVPMGGVLRVGDAEHRLRVRFEATAPIERIDLVRSGHVAALEPPEPRSLSLDLDRRIPPLAPGEFHYVRIVQADGGVAWSSPIFSEPERNSE